ELSYLSTGLSWKADYVARINSTETQLDLNTWVTLTNQSGTSYQNARLQLVAGDVNQVSNTRLNKRSFGREKMSLAMTSQVKEESLLDYHLYSLSNKTELLNNQTKQVALFSRTKIPITKTYRIKGSSYYYHGKHLTIDKKNNATISLSFINNKKSNLALPLPKGIIRSYKNDSANNLQFVGEDQIDHTAKGETVTLNLGKAFDVIASKKQLDFKILSKNNTARLVTEAKYEVVVKNAKDIAMSVLIEEPIPGDWKMITETHKHKKINSTIAQWALPVSANGQTKLVYKVKVTH
ncbi:MAG: DUF4139 domain-containing protein, partial [Gammaproteobacteria bacterium]|nr:DUF4139 domain-containing protein [Gammaproteobacteria bacterium]